MDDDDEKEGPNLTGLQGALNELCNNELKYKERYEFPFLLLTLYISHFFITYCELKNEFTKFVFLGL